MKKNNKQLSIVSILNTIKHQESFDENSIELLVDLVKDIRPSSIYKIKSAENKIRELIYLLKNDSLLCTQFKTLFHVVFGKCEITEVITDSGIIEESGFFSELSKRFSHKFLPPLKVKGSFLSVIGSLFFWPKDYIWIQDVDDTLWVELFEYIDFEINMTDVKVRQQVSRSLNIVSYHIASFGLNKGIYQYYKDSYPENPFTEQSQIVQKLLRAISANEDFEELKSQLSKQLYKCEEVLSIVRKQSIVRGASIKQTHLLLQLSQYIKRIHLVLTLLEEEGKIDYQRIVNQFKLIVENENNKNRIRSYLSESMRFLAYRIAEHERNTGEHYITSSAKEYKAMLKSAMKGGLIISFIVTIKVLLHYVKFAPFWQGFVYSINYSFGFLLIHFTGSTLATKQPAMTASAIASTIERKGRHINMPKLAVLISKVLRSQTASFVGNLSIVFPVVLLIAIISDKLLGFKLVDEHLAQSMIDMQNPLKSLCLLYACFTGVFLFLSGIISGYFDNLVLYSKIPQRIQEHPVLTRIFSKNLLSKIVNLIAKNSGAIMGNLSLGFLLGMSSFIGYIFGIPFDIRHITISAGYYIMGLYGLGFQASFSDIFFSGIGVILIGFFNFLISFSLAFMVALSSRKIKFNKYKSLGKYLFWLLKKYPQDFIFPPKKPRIAEDFVPSAKKK